MSKFTDLISTCGNGVSGVLFTSSGFLQTWLLTVPSILKEASVNGNPDFRAGRMSMLSVNICAVCVMKKS